MCIFFLLYIENSIVCLIIWKMCKIYAFKISCMLILLSSPWYCKYFFFKHDSQFYSFLPVLFNKSSRTLRLNLNQILKHVSGTLHCVLCVLITIIVWIYILTNIIPYPQKKNEFLFLFFQCFTFCDLQIKNIKLRRSSRNIKFHINGKHFLCLVGKKLLSI